MTEDWVFKRTGSFWKQPLYRRVWLNFKYWFKAQWCFIRVLANYKESVIGNEMSIGSAYGLCLSMQEARMGKTLSLEKPQSSTSTAKEG